MSETKTVRISKAHNEKLSKIASIMKEDKGTILERYIDKFFDTLVELIRLEGSEALTKDFVYMPQVRISTLVSGEISMSMSVEDSEVDKIVDKELEKKGVK